MCWKDSTTSRSVEESESESSDSISSPEPEGGTEASQASALRAVRRVAARDAALLAEQLAERIICTPDCCFDSTFWGETLFHYHLVDGVWFDMTQPIVINLGGVFRV